MQLIYAARGIVALTVAWAAINAGGLVAQERTPPRTRPLGVGLAGGFALPVGELGDLATTGFAIKGIIQAIRYADDIGTRFELGYATFPRERAVVSDGVTDARILSAVLSGLWLRRLTPRLEPYAIGGFGIYQLDYGEGPERSGITRFGVSGGVGLRFPIRRVTSFVETRLHFAFGGYPTNYIPLVAGIVY